MVREKTTRISNKFHSFKRFCKSLLRKNADYNKLENQKFTIAYLKKYKEIREYNAKVLFDTFYTKKARQIILKESGYLSTENLVAQRAAALMTLDVANGVLDEFYRFRG